MGSSSLDPVGPAVPLVRAEIEAGLLLAQVVAAVDVPQQGKLASRPFRVGLQFGDVAGEHVLVRHGDDRHLAAEHGADLSGAISGGIHHVLAADVSLRGLHHPFTVAPHPGDRAEPHDDGAEVPCALGEGLGQLGRIDVAVVRVIETAGEIVGLEIGIEFLQLVVRAGPDIHALVAAHADHPLELQHAVLRVRQADRSRHVIVHRVIDRLGEAAVELGRVTLHVHDRPARREGRHVAGGMPGRTGGEFVLLQQHAVGPAGTRQVIEARGSHGAPADDHHPCGPR